MIGAGKHCSSSNCYTVGLTLAATTRIIFADLKWHQMKPLECHAEVCRLLPVEKVPQTRVKGLSHLEHSLIYRLQIMQACLKLLVLATGC